MLRLTLCSILLGLFVTQPCLAFQSHSFFLGLGYYSQNVPNRLAQKDDGGTGFMGTTSYPLLLGMDFEPVNHWYFSPQLMYTLIPRQMSGGAGKVTMIHLGFPVGMNISEGSDSSWDWSIGPGVTQYTTAGAGGTTILNNGTTTQVFAMGGRTTAVTKVTWDFATGYSFGSSKLGLGLIVENLMSSTKRSQNLVFSYAYQFGGRF